MSGIAAKILISSSTLTEAGFCRHTICRHFSWLYTTSVLLTFSPVDSCFALSKFCLFDGKLQTCLQNILDRTLFLRLSYSHSYTLLCESTFILIIRFFLLFFYLFSWTLQQMVQSLFHWRIILPNLPTHHAVSHAPKPRSKELVNCSCELILISFFKLEIRSVWIKHLAPVIISTYFICIHI